MLGEHMIGPLISWLVVLLGGGAVAITVIELVKAWKIGDPNPALTVLEAERAMRRVDRRQEGAEYPRLGAVCVCSKPDHLSGCAYRPAAAVLHSLEATLERVSGAWKAYMDVVDAQAQLGYTHLPADESKLRGDSWDRLAAALDALPDENEKGVSE